MVVPVGLYLAVNAGGDVAGGWGIAMSTDTALALGLFLLVTRLRLGTPAWSASHWR